MTRIVMASVTALTTLAGTDLPMRADVPAVAPMARVRVIADVSLRDVAVAVYDPVHPVIYYSPVHMQRFGPELQAFFLAHEYAHLELRHTRAGALRADVGVRDHLFQARELEADCLAAQRLGNGRRAASLAAVRFFGRLGATRFDNEHPSGTERALRVLECMPG
jgi:hypothetical protein